MFLRGIGLGIIPTILQGLFRKDFFEPQKIAIHGSRVTALFRAVIHLLPIAVALMEIILNWKGRYLGRTFDKQNYYQFAAKAHEIVIQASLSSIALSYIRFQLTFGDGLPFGAFLSALQVTQISYLWSTELWSSVFSGYLRLGRKLAFLAIVIACGLIAATAGPSSAVLLIPRHIVLPSWSTYFFINGTVQDVWPDRIEAKNVPKNCAAIDWSGTVDPSCPSADWSAVLSGILGFNNNTAISFEGSTDITYWFYLQNPDSSYKVASIDLCASGARDQYCGGCPQTLIVEGAMNDLVVWTKSIFASNTSFQNLYYGIDKNFVQPYTLSSCVSDTIQNATDQSPLQFARISETESEITQARRIVAIPGLSKASILADASNISEYRLRWVNLPQINFDNAAIGAVLLHPRASESELQNITACTLGAGWGTSSLIASFTDKAQFYSTIAGVPDSYSIIKMDVNAKTASVPDFSNISDFAYPQRRMTISKNWAQFLNPVFTQPDGSNTTMIHKYMTTSVKPFGDVGTAKIMSLMLTTGLSTFGNELSWQGTLFITMTTFYSSFTYML